MDAQSRAALAAYISLGFPMQPGRDSESLADVAISDPYSLEHEVVESIIVPAFTSHWYIGGIHVRPALSAVADACHSVPALSDSDFAPCIALAIDALDR